MILTAYGTRPEYIKVLPITRELCREKLPHKTLFTGQHKDIVDSSADFALNMTKYKGNRLDEIVKNCLSIPDEVFKGITHVLVQGDTTSVLGLSLAAFHRKIKIIHLEAGLRTHDFHNPYPEEMNRQLVSRLASIHLCPTDVSKENLIQENISSQDIHVVGNTVLDNLVEYKHQGEYKPKVLITMHRRENHPLIKEWFNSFEKIAKENPQLEFTLPLHPNPNVQKWKHLLHAVKTVEPLSYKDLIQLLIQTRLVMTDSGGIQEECSFFNKKCLVCRETTERPESIGLTSFLATDPLQLPDLFKYHLKNYEISTPCPFGDGDSAKKIIKLFKEIIYYPPSS